MDSLEGNTDLGLGFILKPFYFILLMWFVFWLDQRFSLDLYRFGILPRTVQGLIGIFTCPLLHGSLPHLTNNTLPVLALGAGLYYFYPGIATRVVIISWISSGIAIWIIGRESFHIGASGLIYALAGFIFLSGILRRQPNLLALSLLVVFLYGGLVWGILPLQESVSWEAHLSGAFSGFALALNYRNFGPRRKKYSWEDEAMEEVVTQDIAETTTHAEDDDTFKTEIWNDYAGSVHGIRYYYKSKSDSDKEKSKE